MSFIVSYKKRLIIVSFIILSLFIVWYYYDNKDVIATVGSFKIREAAFKKEMAYRGGMVITELNKKALLEEMIEKKLLLNKAYVLGFDKSFEIQREFEYLLMGKVRKEFIEAPRKEIDVSVEALKMYYKEHKEEYKKAEKKRFAILFFSKKNNPSLHEKEEVLEKLKIIQKLYLEDKLPSPKKGFGAYSMDYSEHQVSRYQGGMIGWFTKSTALLWEEKVIKHGFKLQQVGDISKVIETDKGFYLVRLTEEQKSKYLLFEKVENRIRHALIKEKQRAIKDIFKGKLLEDFSVSINLEKLDGIYSSVHEVNNTKNNLPFQMIQ